MRKIWSILIALLMFLALSSAALAQGEVTRTSHESLPVHFQWDAPDLEAEGILVDGYISTYNQMVVVNEVYHYNFVESINLTGVGITSGAKYTISGIYKFNTVTNYPASQVNHISNLRIVGQGPANNEIMHLNEYWDIGQNGEITGHINDFTSYH